MPTGISVSGEHARDRSDAAVAAADHHGVDLFFLGLAQGPLGACFQLRAGKKFQRRGDAMVREGSGNRFAQRPAIAAHDSACRLVEEHGNPDGLCLGHGHTRVSTRYARDAMR